MDAGCTPRIHSGNDTSELALRSMIWPELTSLFPALSMGLRPGLSMLLLPCPPGKSSGRTLTPGRQWNAYLGLLLELSERKSFNWIGWLKRRVWSQQPLCCHPEGSILQWCNDWKTDPYDVGLIPECESQSVVTSWTPGLRCPKRSLQTINLPNLQGLCHNSLHWVSVICVSMNSE